MKVIGFGVVALSLTGLAGCEQTVTVSQPADCGAAAMQGYIGQEFDGSMVPPGADPVRVGGPNTPMTMDFRPDRLTIVLDAQGNLAEAKCQ